MLLLMKREAPAKSPLNSAADCQVRALYDRGSPAPVFIPEAAHPVVYVPSNLAGPVTIPIAP
jgi:hypothetical protein